MISWCHGSHPLDGEGSPWSLAHPALDGHGGHVLEHHVLHLTAEEGQRLCGPLAGAGGSRGGKEGGPSRKEEGTGVARAPAGGDGPVWAGRGHDGLMVQKWEGPGRGRAGPGSGRDQSRCGRGQGRCGRGGPHL